MIKLTDKANICTSLEVQMEELFGEEIGSVIERERSTFDKLTAPFSESLVLVGAAELGRQILAYLRKIGVEPLAFADNNPGLWNTTIDGLRVLPVPNAAEEFRYKAAFVITIFGAGMIRPMVDVTQQLMALNCSRIASFCHLFWKFPETFLPCFNLDSPHKVYQQAEDVRKAFSLWADEASRREFLAQLKWRTFLDYHELSSPVTHEIYFPDDITSVSSDEVFVDCGAFDGDTLRSFLRRQGSFFSKYIAFEPDPASFHKFEQYVEMLPNSFQEKIAMHQMATGSCRQKLRFNATGTHGSSVGAGTSYVDSVSLDEVLRDCIPPYVKMDVEGAEIDTLIGARKLIEHNFPVLAISLYHRQDHLWKIPLLIRSISEQYRFFLRPHQFAFWDYILYAIPFNRLAA